MDQKRNLIIGGVSNYGWEEVKYWVNSIKKSGFEGDIVLIASNMPKEEQSKITNEGGVRLIAYDNTVRSSMTVHVERMIHIHRFLIEYGKYYDYVIATDVRDVVFQSDPVVWLKNNPATLVASSEMMTYENEPWNSKNLMDTFGPYIHSLFRKMMINNVGVIAGKAEYVQDMLFMIAQMSMNRPIPIVDQVVYNILLNQSVIADNVLFTANEDAWAINLGTSEEAIRAGSGDIGLIAKSDPSKLQAFLSNYIGKQPTIDDENYVVNGDGVRFCIVHQYDRTPAWKGAIEKRYA